MSEGKDFIKDYTTRLSGKLRAEFEEYRGVQEMSEAEALRECIKSHLRNKQTTPDIQNRLRSIEQLLREVEKKIG